MHKQILNAYSFLIKWIVNISACIDIDNKKKQKIAGFMMFILCVLGILRHLKTSLKAMINYTDSAAIITGTVALIILLIVSADKYIDYRRININKLCLYGWLLCFVMAFIMAFINPVRTGYFVWSMISIFISIPFVMIWALRDDFFQFCIMLARVMAVTAFCFVIVNLLLVPFIKPSDLPGYFGLMSNPNGNGMIITGLYAASFFLLLIEKKGSAVLSVITGFCIAFCFASECRTAQFAIALESIVGTVYYLKYIRHKGKNPDTKKIILTGAVVVTIALAASFILIEIGKMDINAYAFDDFSTIVSEEKKAELFNNIDQMSSGRLYIWKLFISNATFWGNGSPQEPLLPGYEPSFYAHNNVIEILYTSGVIAFIGYTLFLISGIVFVVRCISGKSGYKKEYVLVITAFTGYFVEAMLEIVMYSECHMPAILLNLCMMPIFINNNKEPNQISDTAGGRNA